MLAPLNGSALSEQALTPAARIAQATKSLLLLARVTPLVTWPLGAMHVGGGMAPVLYDELLAAEDHAAHLYLEEAQRLRAGGCAVETRALRGEVASTLIEKEATKHVGLVVMTTHGRAGLVRFALGSVAEHLVHGGRAPVLLLRSLMADGLGLAERLERALVPLDGSARAELALDVCARLAGSMLKQITLARVVERA